MPDTDAVAAAVGQEEEEAAKLTTAATDEQEHRKDDSTATATATTNAEASEDTKDTNNETSALAAAAAPTIPGPILKRKRGEFLDLPATPPGYEVKRAEEEEIVAKTKTAQEDESVGLIVVKCRMYNADPQIKGDASFEELQATVHSYETVYSLKQKLGKALVVALPEIKDSSIADGTTYNGFLQINGSTILPTDEKSDNTTMLGCGVTSNNASIQGWLFSIVDRRPLIFVKTLSSPPLALVADLSKQVVALKRLIRDKEGIPLDQQRLIFRGRTLEDIDVLESCGVQFNSTLHLVLKQRRGGILYGGGILKTVTERWMGTAPAPSAPKYQAQFRRERTFDLSKANVTADITNWVQILKAAAAASLGVPDPAILATLNALAVGIQSGQSRVDEHTAQRGEHDGSVVATLVTGEFKDSKWELLLCKGSSGSSTYSCRAIYIRPFPGNQAAITLVGETALNFHAIEELYKREILKERET